MGGSNGESLDYRSISGQIEDHPVPEDIPFSLVISTVDQCFSPEDVCGRTYANYEAIMEASAGQWGMGEAHRGQGVARDPPRRHRRGPGSDRRGARSGLATAEGVEGRHVLVAEGEAADVCVGVDAVGVDRLRDDDDLVLQVPADDHLRRRTARPLGDLDDRGVLEGPPRRAL